MTFRLRALGDRGYPCAMPSPFLGMDPYLEHSRLWPDVHNGLIAALRTTLGPLLRPRYYVRLEERVYLCEAPDTELVGAPDVLVGTPRGERARRRRPRAEDAPASSALAVRVPVPDQVRETYLEIRPVGREDEDVVTVLELLSPANKRPGKGRRLYSRKRADVLSTRTSLVEIDLVRAGEPMPVYGTGRTGDYRILVSRGRSRPDAELYVWGVRDPIPRFRLPLRRDDEEPEVDLGAVLADLYDKAGYDLVVDYSKDPEPPLAERDRTWARKLLRRRHRP